VVSVGAQVRLAHLWQEPLGGAWYNHVKPYLEMMVKSEPLRDVDDLMTSLVLSQGTNRPAHKLHVPATHSKDFTRPNQDYSTNAKALIEEKLKGIPIGQVSEVSREIAKILLQSMGDIFPSYRRLDSVIEW
jgi:hypothetical protein